MADISNKKTEVIKEVLPVQLTDEERLSRADDLANAVQNVEDAKRHKKIVTRDASAKVEEAEANRADLADVVASGREYQEVVVHRVFNYEDGTVFEVRTDTGETLRSRNMTDEERQASLLDDSDAAGN